MASCGIRPSTAIARPPSTTISSSIRLILPKIHHLPKIRRSGAISQSAFHLIISFTPSRRRLHRGISAFSAESDSSSDLPIKQSSGFREWDAMTARFAGAANVPFLLLQVPQIILNYRNLASGNNAALFAIPWLGMLTGLLGNLSLLSYFAKKRETEAVIVQTLGVLSTYTVLAQLAIAGSMPLFHFALTSVVIAFGLVLNFLNYFNYLGEGLWTFWEDFITVGGLAVLPQVMWSTFVPFVPDSIFPGTFSSIVAVLAVFMARTGKLSEEQTQFVGSLSGWTATLLFMWMPIAQMWTNYLSPENIRGLSPTTMLLAMIGNGLMIPRALFIRDLMWFTGSTWASFLQGWGNLLCMYCFNSITKEFFSGATVLLLLWLGIALWRDSTAYGHSSPVKSLHALVFGKGLQIMTGK